MARSVTVSQSAGRTLPVSARAGRVEHLAAQPGVVAPALVEGVRVGPPELEPFRRRAQEPVGRHVQHRPSAHACSGSTSSSAQSCGAAAGGPSSATRTRRSGGNARDPVHDLVEQRGTRHRTDPHPPTLTGCPPRPVPPSPWIGRMPAVELLIARNPAVDSRLRVRSCGCRWAEPSGRSRIWRITVVLRPGDATSYLVPRSNAVAERDPELRRREQSMARPRLSPSALRAGAAWWDRCRGAGHDPSHPVRTRPQMAHRSAEQIMPSAGGTRRTRGGAPAGYAAHPVDQGRCR